MLPSPNWKCCDLLSNRWRRHRIQRQEWELCIAFFSSRFSCFIPFVVIHFGNILLHANYTINYDAFFLKRFCGTVQFSFYLDSKKKSHIKFSHEEVYFLFVVYSPSLFVMERILYLTLSWCLCMCVCKHPEYAAS